jgi:hypothetical protein
MGGQACVFYGAAEFSRDTDLFILAAAENITRLRVALRELEAECIAVPPFEVQYLERGHAVHFRCHHPEAADMRVDLMSKLRGVEPFETVWKRRTTVTDSDETRYDLLALPDLVKAKKTQRGKDWPMLQRLVEANYLQHRTSPTIEQKQFWMRELRTPELLIEVVQAWPELGAKLTPERSLLALARPDAFSQLQQALASEEQLERERDQLYWQPLKAELERLRRSRVRKE